MRYIVEYIHVDKSLPVALGQERRTMMELAIYSCKNLEDASETASLTAEAVMTAHCSRQYNRPPSEALDHCEINVVPFLEWAEARESNGDSIIQAAWALDKQTLPRTQSPPPPAPQPVDDFSMTGMYTGY